MVNSRQAQDKKSKIFSLCSKRAQMKIQQMAFMLMAVTLFFVLVGMFVVVWRFSGLKQSATALGEENAMLLVTKLANSPEFSCGNSFGGSKINCIDMDKVITLKEDIGKYSGFWGRGVFNIRIERIYPVGQGRECSIGNYPDCDNIDLFSNGIKGVPAWNFVTLCKKDSDEGGIYDNCQLGKLFVYYNEE